MRFENVHVASVAHELPEERVSSEALEDRLAPVYERLRLRTGRLELMSGIRERRFWPPGTRPSEVAARAGARALAASGIDPSRIGCLVHASVCRDFLEPATASVVHATLGLPATCAAFDLSNACLGVANAMVVLGHQIDAGAIDAGLVVAGETGRPLVEETVKDLLERDDVTREDLKLAFASLTIGSGAAAVVLSRGELAPRERPLVGGAARAATEHHVLCHGDVQAGRVGPLMRTDSEALLLAGNELAARTGRAFREETGWNVAEVDRVVTHQVGTAHRRMVLGTLGVGAEADYPTVERLGNIGSVSLPLSLSLASEEGFLLPGQRVALLGIGSGLHCLMLGARW